MLAWTWGTWPDALVDFGEQLYMPWQISQGEVLYRDIAYHNGPVSQYWNALWFWLFGTSLRTVVIVNLSLLGGLTALLYHVLRQVAGRLASTAGCLVFLLLFAFAQFVVNGNYNYVCPYAHEATHGLMLSLGALACAWAYPRRGLPAVAAAGFLIGLLFLTKLEVSIAGSVATVTALGLTLLTLGITWRRAAAFAGAFLGAALVPPLIAFLSLWSQMDATGGLRGTLGSWLVAANPQMVNLLFFRSGMGTDDVAGSLRLMFAYAGWLAGIAGLPVLLSLAQGKQGPARTVLAAAFVVIAVAIWTSWIGSEWPDVGRPLPLVMLAAAAVITVVLVMRRRDRQEAQRLIRQLSLTVFGGAMLAKMALNARIYHYGFVLAMPAAVVVTVLLLDWLPAVVRRFGGAGVIVRAAGVAMLAVVVAVHLHVQGQLMATKTWLVGTGADTFRSDAIGRLINETTGAISQRCPPGHTLAVLPEGAMLNYLCRRANPTPYTNFIPSVIIYHGEDNILKSLRAHPPDMIVLAHKDTSEFGYRFFGRDYGQDLYAWIWQNYAPTVRIGAMPLTSDQFGILLMERRAQR